MSSYIYTMGSCSGKLDIDLEQLNDVKQLANFNMDKDHYNKATRNAIRAMTVATLMKQTQAQPHLHSKDTTDIN
jgi:F0F1-type ATP synthase alpha subunit